jgi:dihydroxycyclohexadiene carboxylate dehydrogenase
MAEEGAALVVADRHSPGAERTCLELRGSGAQAEAFIGDVSSWEGAQTLMAFAKRAFGRIDILVNNVGGTIWGGQPYWEYTPEQILQEVQNNLWPTLWCCRAVLPFMLEQHSGCIVNLGSDATRGTLRLPYAASKGGVFALTTSLALEVATLGIRVNCVAPAWTEVADRLAPRNPSRQRGEDPQTARRRMEERFLPGIPMARPGTPEEQAAAIVFLASDDASFITGQILTVGGGAHAP